MYCCVKKQVFFIVLLAIVVCLSSYNYYDIIQSNDSVVEHESNIIAQVSSESVPYDIRYPFFPNVTASGEPILVLSSHENLKEDNVVYILCIWADGTILWNPFALEWCLATRKNKTFQEVPIKYLWKKVDKKTIAQLETSISQNVSVMGYSVPFGVVTLFDIYFSSNEKIDFMRIGFFPIKEVEHFFMKSEIFGRANLIMEESLKIIPNSEFYQIDKKQIKTLTKKVHISSVP